MKLTKPIILESEKKEITLELNVDDIKQVIYKNKRIEIILSAESILVKK